MSGRFPVDPRGSWHRDVVAAPPSSTWCAGFPSFANERFVAFPNRKMTDLVMLIFMRDLSAVRYCGSLESLSVTIPNIVQ